MPNNKKDELTEEDYLKKHLGNLENSNDAFITDIPLNKPTVDNVERVDELQFFSFDINMLPCGKYYPSGSVLKVRPANVIQIQAYAMVDDTNLYDIVEKMNDMLRDCVRIKYQDGSHGSYLDIKDQDRLFIIFLIRELTFQEGNSLSVPAQCECGEKLQIELKKENFDFHTIDPNLNSYFDKSINGYRFELTNGKVFIFNPPSIGLQKSFTDYILKEQNEKNNKPNLAFLKIIPFMLGDRTSITYDGIKAKLEEFQAMDDVSFQFLNSAVGKMTFGIKRLKKTCKCGEEVYAEMQFPNGTSGIFVVHNAFEAYIKK